MENISCIFIIAILIYMLYVVNTQFSTEIGDVFSGIEGTWGMPFWAATTSFLGIYSTMIINASDYSRNATDDISRSRLQAFIRLRSFRLRFLWV